MMEFGLGLWGMQATRMGFPWPASAFESFAEIRARNELYRKTLAASGRLVEAVLFPAASHMRHA